MHRERFESVLRAQLPDMFKECPEFLRHKASFKPLSLFLPQLASISATPGPPPSGPVQAAAHQPQGNMPCTILLYVSASLCLCLLPTTQAAIELIALSCRRSASGAGVWLGGQHQLPLSPKGLSAMITSVVPRIHRPSLH